jgi:hypothetical protein
MKNKKKAQTKRNQINIELPLFAKKDMVSFRNKKSSELSHEQIEFLHYIIEGNFFVFENKKAANS